MHEQIIYFPKYPETALLAPQIAGISHCDGSYHICREHSDITVLEYVVSGGGTLLTADGPLRAEKGQVYCLPRGERQEYFSDKKNGWEKIFFNLYGELPEILLNAYGLHERVMDAPHGTGALFRQVLARVSDLTLPPRERAMQMTLGFHQILLFISTAPQGEVTEAERMLSYLQANLQRTVSNRELAGVVFRSESTCVQRFTQAYGITPCEYQTREKMRTARQLLSDTGMSVGQIADYLGYPDQHYFANLFRRRVGCTPTLYRAQKAGQSPEAAEEVLPGAVVKTWTEKMV